MLNITTLTFLKNTHPISFANARCAYCGVAFGEGVKRTKDHVIGRKFVPAGRMNDEWNLILNACEACNHAKSQLEDDISAITMQPNILGQHAVDDDLLREDAKRKGEGSTSRKTQRPVIKSQEEMSISGNLFPGVHATFNMKRLHNWTTRGRFNLRYFSSEVFFIGLPITGKSSRAICQAGRSLPWGLRNGSTGVMSSFADFRK